MTKQQIIDLRNEGKTYAEIGEIFGVSRQRVHQAIGKDRIRKSNFLTEKIKKSTRELTRNNSRTIGKEPLYFGVFELLRQQVRMANNMSATCQQHVNNMSSTCHQHVINI